MARRIALWCLAGFVIVGAIAAFLQLVLNMMFWGGICASEFVREFASPDNRTIVVTVENCGATTDYTTRAEFKFKDGREETYFLMVEGWNKIDVIWTDKFAPKGYEPTVVYERPKRLWRKAVVWRGINISYQEVQTERSEAERSRR